MENNKNYFVSLKAFIEKDGKLLCLENNNGGLDFPGGQIQNGAIEDELMREVFEETNLKIKVGNPFCVWDIPVAKENKNVFFVGFKCQYESGELKLSHEHSSYIWVDKSNFKAKVKKDDIWSDILKKYFEQQ